MQDLSSLGGLTLTTNGLGIGIELSLIKMLGLEKACIVGTTYHCLKAVSRFSLVKILAADVILFQSVTQPYKNTFKTTKRKRDRIKLSDFKS